MTAVVETTTLPLLAGGGKLFGVDMAGQVPAVVIAALFLFALIKVAELYLGRKGASETAIIMERVSRSLDSTSRTQESIMREQEVVSRSVRDMCQAVEHMRAAFHEHDKTITIALTRIESAQLHARAIKNNSAA